MPRIRKQTATSVTVGGANPIDTQWEDHDPALKKSNDAKVRELNHKKAPFTLVDLGCGYDAGFVQAYLEANKTHAALGFDNLGGFRTPAELAEVGATPPDIAALPPHLVLRDATRTGVRKASVDKVTLLMPIPGQIRGVIPAMLKEAARILKRGGEVVVVIQGPHWPKDKDGAIWKKDYGIPFFEAVRDAGFRVERAGVQLSEEDPEFGASAFTQGYGRAAGTGLYAFSGRLPRKSERDAFEVKPPVVPDFTRMQPPAPLGTAYATVLAPADAFHALATHLGFDDFGENPLETTGLEMLTPTFERLKPTDVEVELAARSPGVNHAAKHVDTLEADPTSPAAARIWTDLGAAVEQWIESQRSDIPLEGVDFRLHVPNEADRGSAAVTVERALELVERHGEEGRPGLSDHTALVTLSPLPSERSARSPATTYLDAKVLAGEQDDGARAIDVAGQLVRSNEHHRMWKWVQADQVPDGTAELLNQAPMSERWRADLGPVDHLYEGLARLGELEFLSRAAADGVTAIEDLFGLRFAELERLGTLVMGADCAQVRRAFPHATQDFKRRLEFFNS